MFDLSGQQTVIPITIWWLKNLGTDWQEVNRQCKILYGQIQSQKTKQGSKVWYQVKI
jgi:hypothetical protein